MAKHPDKVNRVRAENQFENSSIPRGHLPLPPPPWEISTGVAPPLMEALGGEFIIVTDRHQETLKVVNGGGKTTDAIHTGGGQPGDSSIFKFWVDSAAHQYYAFQTIDGHFITANNAGGLITNTMFSIATEIGGWEMFKLQPQTWFPAFTIQTLRGFFLTAVDGGGHDDDDAIHTDALMAAEWERYEMARAGDFGMKSTYVIEARGPYQFGNRLTAPGGGGYSVPGDLTTYPGAPYEVSWTLLKQGDGTYAFQMTSGYFLTAIGGGIPGLGFRTNTEFDQIGDWEKFTLVDNGDFTAYIKTHVGSYLTTSDDDGPENVRTVVNVNEATRWRFWVVSLGL